MGLLESIRSTFDVAEPERRRSIVGAYWCDDCSVRRPVENRPDEKPTCPECDGPMRFERSPDSGSCAC